MVVWLLSISFLGFGEQPLPLSTQRLENWDIYLTCIIVNVRWVSLAHLPSASTWQTISFSTPSNSTVPFSSIYGVFCAASWLAISPLAPLHASVEESHHIMQGTQAEVSNIFLFNCFCFVDWMGSSLVWDGGETWVLCGTCFKVMWPKLVANKLLNRCMGSSRFVADVTNIEAMPGTCTSPTRHLSMEKSTGHRRGTRKYK